jgi:hypothetical protein
LNAVKISGIGLLVVGRIELDALLFSGMKSIGKDLNFGSSLGIINSFVFDGDLHGAKRYKNIQLFYQSK